jgi:hypothetical protein
MYKCLNTFLKIYVFRTGLCTYILKNGLCLSYDTMFNFLRNNKSVLQCLTILYSPHQCRKIPVCSNPSSNLLLSFSYLSHPKGYEVVSHRDVDQDFSNTVPYLLRCLSIVSVSPIQMYVCSNPSIF